MTTLYSYERSVLYPNGHRNMVFTNRGVPILKIDPADHKPDSSPRNPCRSTGTPSSHARAAPFQNAANIAADKLYSQRSGYRPASYIWNALAKGYRMGREAASDHCSTHVSYSCILTTGTSRQDLVDAMRRRHCYGATDNIILDIRVEADGREYLQGDEIPATTHYVLRVNALGSGPIRKVAVIHNESYAYEVFPAGQRETRFRYVDAHPSPGENCYYVRVEQEDGNLAWSSPIWIQST